MEDLQVRYLGSARLADGLNMVDLEKVLHQKEESAVRTAPILGTEQPPEGGPHLRVVPKPLCPVRKVPVEE